MPRIYELARELGVSSREVLAELEELGYPVGSHAASIDPTLAERVKHQIRNGDGGEGLETGLDPSSEPTGRVPRLAVEQGSAPSVRESRARGAEEDKNKKKGWLSHLTELPLLVLFALVVAVLIKTFLIQAFFIPSGSMIPTLRVGDRVLVEKVSYAFGTPKRGQVVVFEKSVFGKPLDVPWYLDARNFLRELLGLPTGENEDYIKRVVALGGDVIKYDGTPRKLMINGDIVDEPYLKKIDRSSPTLTSRDCRRLKMDRAGGGCLVPAGRVFVMGDNRPNSEDSRVLGPVDEEKIVGHAFIVIWPPGDFGTI
jgi:signal peptidase I